jgi:ribonuclease P protein subunit RPR2
MDGSLCQAYILLLRPTNFCLFFNETMAKTKVNATVQNRAIYSRASYLYQAANYLTSCANAIPDASSTCSAGHSASAETEKQRKAISNTSRRAIADMRDVSLKVQIRQSPALKRTICKYCDSLLVEGKTSRSLIENPSKGGRKPWADVLVIECRTCGNSKRYPVDAPRQKRKGLRSQTRETVGDGHGKETKKEEVT